MFGIGSGNYSASIPYCFIWEYWIAAPVIVVVAALVSASYYMSYQRRIRRTEVLLSEGRTKEYIAETEKLLETAKGQKLRNILKLNLAAGYLDMLDKGVSYKELKHSFVIFICTFDAFDREYYRYTFENMCQEVDGLYLNDGTTKIFLNALGSGNVTDEIIQEYIKNQDLEERNKSDNFEVVQFQAALAANPNPPALNRWWFSWSDWPHLLHR